MKPLRFQLSGVPVGPGQPVRVMGVINVSPESFFKGSIPSSRSALISKVRRMEDDGADAIDVGAMSTAPYLKTQISEQEEARRLAQAVETIAKHTRLPVSIDSFRAGPAAAGLEAGGTILNDISGLQADSDMPKVARRARSVILMANPRYFPRVTGHPIPVIKIILQSILKKSRAANLPLDRIILDPGIGFVRNQPVPWWKWDLAILQNLKQMTRIGAPLLVGVSRKSFIGKILQEKNPDNRLAGSLAATAIAVINGVSVIRTHDVKETKQAVRMAELLRKEEGTA